MPDLPKILVTGANGNIGHTLLPLLSPTHQVFTLDHRNLDPTLIPHVSGFFKGDLTNPAFIFELFSTHHFDAVIHLAALLSHDCDDNPFYGHQVNVNGSINLLEAASRSRAETKFIFISSVAVFGLDPLEKPFVNTAPPEPTGIPQTAYGCTKRYLELMGGFYGRDLLDFRTLRLPTILSPNHRPIPGTSDFFQELVVQCLTDKTAICHLRPDTTLPLITLPDAALAIIHLFKTPHTRLHHTTYQVQSFSTSVQEFIDKLQKHFPTFQPEFYPDSFRQGIIDSWPNSLDDQDSVRDLDWSPTYDLHSALWDYLVPATKELLNR